MLFQQLDKDLWVYVRTVRFAGIPLPHTMTVVRLPAGGLFVHSPTFFDLSTASAFAPLGEIDSIVWPSWWHDMYLNDYAAAYPRARLFGAPVLVKWHRRMQSLQSLDECTPVWAPCLDQINVDRMRLFLDEFVFLHRSSRSVVVADLSFYLDDSQDWFTKLSFGAIGAYPGCNIPWFYRLAPKSRRYLRDKIDRILDWDFDRLIVGHGGVLETGGKNALRNAYRWLYT
jgi:Domain of unknown function (DUF4336)